MYVSFPQKGRYRWILALTIAGIFVLSLPGNGGLKEPIPSMPAPEEADWTLAKIHGDKETDWTLT